MKAKKLLKNLKISGLKLKSCKKIWKPAVESKKVAEISENGCKHKVAEKPAVESKKVLKNLKTGDYIA